MGGGQSKIYLQPIQMSIPTKAASEKKPKTTLKEKCMMCDTEILLSELRAHFLLCNKDILDCEYEDGTLDGWLIPTTSDATSTSKTVVVESQSPTNQVDTTFSVQMNNMVSQTPTEQVDLTEVTHEQVDPTEVTNENVIDISQLETVSDVIDIDKFTPPDLINIHEKVNKIVGHCRENGFSDNAVEVLRLLQAELVVGLNMEIASPDSVLKVQQI